MNRTQGALLLVLLVVVAAVGGGWLLKELTNKGPSLEVESPVEDVATGTPPPDRPATGPSPTQLERVEQEPVALPPDTEDTATLVNPEAGEAGVLQGVVVGPDQQPILDAEVELARGGTMVAQMPSLREETGLSLTTDGNGAFRFDQIAPGGDYILIAKHPDFGDGIAGPVALRGGQMLDVGFIQLRNGTSISGVISYNGRAIPGATVRLDQEIMTMTAKRNDRRKVLETIETDEFGSYRFDAVSTKNFLVTVDADGFGLQTKNNRAFLTEEKDQTIDFDLTPAYAVSGVVLDSQRRPIEGASVHGSITGASYRCEAEAITGADGFFLIEQLSDGHYHLTANADEHSSAHKPKVAAGSTDVELVMLSQGAVSGLVVSEASGAPVTQFTLEVLKVVRGREPSGTGQRKAFTADDGTFEFVGLDPFEYVLEARAKGFAPTRSEPFTASRGETVPEIRIAMNLGGSVTGVVVDHTGAPQRGVQVVLNDNHFKWSPVHDILGRMGNQRATKLKTRTDETGTFTIDLVVPGTYQVATKSPDFSTTETNDVEVLGGQVTDVGELELRQGGRLEGVCYDELGNPLAGATVSAVSDTKDHVNGRCTPDGRYTLAGLRPGEYTISINSYVTDPPENVLLQMLKAKNSRRTVFVTDGDLITVDLRLSSEDPNGSR